MRVLVTGASGFLGRALVAACVAAGHEPVALVRPASELPDELVDRDGAPVAVHRGDLRRNDWSVGLGPIDAVIHAAASTSGDVATQATHTILATEQLLDGIDLGAIDRFVLVSSFSVYDFAGTPVGSTLAADRSPLEPHPEARDAYTQTKLFQERWVRQRCADRSTPLVVMRPGIVFGPGRTWGYGAAFRLGPFDVVLSPGQETRFTHVGNCAAAIVAALDAPDAAGGTFDVVDDERPTNLELHRLARRAGADLPPALPVPWRVVDAIGLAVSMVDRVLFGARARLPEVLERRRQHARWKPLRYDNGPTRAVLGWSPHVTLRQAVDEAVRHG